MQGEKSICDRRIYEILQFLTTLVIGNIYFILSNALIIIYSIMVMIEPKSFSVFILMALLIPSGPSITALCSAMGKLVRENECNITKEYFTAYKENFKESIILSLVFGVGGFIALLDYKFFMAKGSLLAIVFIALGVYILLLIMYTFPILSVVKIEKKSLLSLAFYYSIKRIHITIIKTGLIVIGAIISSKINFITITFIFSLICYLIMLCDNKMILEIKEMINTNNLN